jgi:hypothetical protein
MMCKSKKSIRPAAFENMDDGYDDDDDVHNNKVL